MVVLIAQQAGGSTVNPHYCQEEREEKGGHLSYWIRILILTQSSAKTLFPNKSHSQVLRSYDFINRKTIQPMMVKMLPLYLDLQWEKGILLGVIAQVYTPKLWDWSSRDRGDKHLQSGFLGPGMGP